jgi:hypothetical protein
MAAKSGNVFFVAVARLKDRVVVASHAFHAKIDGSGVREVLEQPQMKGMLPGRNYSFSVGGDGGRGGSAASLTGGGGAGGGSMVWHLTCDDAMRVYLVITALDYPARCATALLSELQRAFAVSCGGQVTGAKPDSLTRAAKGVFVGLCEKYARAEPMARAS